MSNTLPQIQLLATSPLNSEYIVKNKTVTKTFFSKTDNSDQRSTAIKTPLAKNGTRHNAKTVMQTPLAKKMELDKTKQNEIKNCKIFEK